MDMDRWGDVFGITCRGEELGNEPAGELTPLRCGPWICACSICICCMPPTLIDWSLQCSCVCPEASNPATLGNGGHDGVQMAKQEGGRSAENVETPATGRRRHGSSGLFGLSSDESGTLVVVATLITTLSYQIGSNVPGGYWQDDAAGHHLAGEPIMRTQRLWLYRVFVWSNWFGFAASMGLTLSLLTGVPPRCRFVRGLFVLSYSSLVLSFTTQQWRSHSNIWISVLVWTGAVALIASAINYRTHRHFRRLIDWLFAEPVAQTS